MKAKLVVGLLVATFANLCSSQIEGGPIALTPFPVLSPFDGVTLSIALETNLITDKSTNILRWRIKNNQTNPVEILPPSPSARLDISLIPTNILTAEELNDLMNEGLLYRFVFDDNSAQKACKMIPIDSRNENQPDGASIVVKPGEERIISQKIKLPHTDANGNCKLCMSRLVSTVNHPVVPFWLFSNFLDVNVENHDGGKPQKP